MVRVHFKFIRTNLSYIFIYAISNKKNLTKTKDGLIVNYESRLVSGEKDRRNKIGIFKI